MKRLIRWVAKWFAKPMREHNQNALALDGAPPAMAWSQCCAPCGTSIHEESHTALYAPQDYGLTALQGWSVWFANGHTMHTQAHCAAMFADAQGKIKAFR